MAMLGQMGDLSTTQVSNGFEPLPAGQYKASVIETELVPTKDDSGQLLKAKFKVLEGEYTNRTIITRFNLINKNAQAQEIGRGQLKALATYSGHPNPNQIRNTEELHGRPVIITLSVKPAKDGYDASNEIKAYAYVGGNQGRTGTLSVPSGPPKPPAPPAPAPAAPAASAPVVPPAGSDALLGHPPVAEYVNGVPVGTQPAAPAAPVAVAPATDLKAAAGF